MNTKASEVCTIKVQIPFHLQTLAQAEPQVVVNVAGAPTARNVIAALEAKYPALQGAVIDPHTGKRRPLLRYFACQEDWTFEAPDTPLPEAVARGREVFMIVGAISGG
jgi:hypothetical protein